MTKEKYTFKAEGRELNITIEIQNKEDMKIVKDIIKRIKYNLKK